MKRTLFSLLVLTPFLSTTIYLTGCASRGDSGLVVGGILGGLAGAGLSRGNTVGTVAGAVGGALIGREVARRN